MGVPINIPKLGVSMSEGTLVEWLVQDGESVTEGAGPLPDRDRQGRERRRVAGRRGRPHHGGRGRDLRRRRPDRRDRDLTVAPVASRLAEERPDEVALRDDRVALALGRGRARRLNRVANGLRGARPRRRTAASRCSPRTAPRRCWPTSAGCWPGRLDGAGQLPPQRRGGGLHPRRLRRPGALRGSRDGGRPAWPPPARPALRPRRSAGAASRPRASRRGTTGWPRPTDAEPPTDVAPRPNLMYTSGTTGRPKGVELPPDDVRRRLDHRRAPRRAGQEHVRRVRHPPRGRADVPHRSRCRASGCSPWASRWWCSAGSTPRGVLRAIDTYRTETSVMVPTHFARLLALPEEVRARYDVSSMQLVGAHRRGLPDRRQARDDRVVGAGVLRRLRRHRGGHHLHDHQRGVARAPRLGRPRHPAVHRDRGRRRRRTRCRPSTEGRLFFDDATGRGIVYPNDPEKTADAHLRPGVFTLGEIGYVDDDGYVFITDRFSDMIVSGGVNIYPAEAEQVLIEHPGVADVAVIGVPHRGHGRGGQGARRARRPGRPARRRPSSSPSAASGWPRYKCPRSVDIVDTVGRTTMGKVNKRALAGAVLGLGPHHRWLTWRSTTAAQRLVSLAAGTVLDIGPAETVAVAARAGYDGVGLWFDPDTWTDATTREVAARLRRHRPDPARHGAGDPRARRRSGRRAGGHRGRAGRAPRPRGRRTRVPRRRRRPLRRALRPRRSGRGHGGAGVPADLHHRHAARRRRRGAGGEPAQRRRAGRHPPPRPVRGPPEDLATVPRSLFPYLQLADATGAPRRPVAGEPPGGGAARAAAAGRGRPAAGGDAGRRPERAASRWSCAPDRSWSATRTPPSALGPCSPPPAPSWTRRSGRQPGALAQVPLSLATTGRHRHHAVGWNRM